MRSAVLTPSSPEAGGDFLVLFDTMLLRAEAETAQNGCSYVSVEQKPIVLVA